LLGANPDLEPEKARTLSAGVDIGPDLVAGLSASATFFSIDLENRIDTLDVFSALSREQEFAGAVTRNPDPQIAQGFLDHPLANDFGLGLAGSDIDIILDGRVANTARTKIHGLDGSVAYERDLGAGAASVGVDASYIFDFLEAFSPSSPLIETVDTLGRQPDFRARFHAAWRSPAVNASLFVNYTDGYRDDVSAPPRRGKSWTSVDLSLAAVLSTVAARTSLSGLRATFFISNLFDAAPPFANNPNGAAFDPNNANPRGRYAALEIDKSW
jgi:iron complex outermembrane receptor protein